MAYVSQEMKKALAPNIKAVLKKYGLKGSIAVRHHMSLVVNIRAGKLDFMNAIASDGYVPNGYIQVNPYWIDENYNDPDVRACLKELVAALKGPDYFDESDAMVDYFHCSHYIDINVGRWDKPYVLEA